MEVLSPNSKFETMLSYEENFYNEEEMEMEFMTIQENAIMLFQFEDNVNALVQEESTEIKVVGEVEMSKTEKEGDTQQSEFCESETVKLFTILPPKKQRDAMKKSVQKKSKKSKKKATPKVQKWTGVDNSHIGINLTLFPRPTKSTEFEGDIDNLLSEIDQELDIFEKLSANFVPVIELESDNRKLKYLRKDRSRKVEKAYKQVKTKYGRNVRNNKGRRKLYINHRVLARIQLDEHRSDFHIPSRGKSLNNRSTLEDGKNKPQPRNSHWQDHNHAAPVQNLAFALDTVNNPSNYEANTLSLLISLQHRELTPEDYELLSILDQSVAPKTVSQNIIDNFKTVDVSETMAGKICSVCLELYTIGQNVKYLPCGHDFHSQCIEMWLSNSSMNCPLDGLPVDN